MKKFFSSGIAAIAGIFAGAFGSLSAINTPEDYAASVLPRLQAGRYRHASKPGRAGAKLAKQAGKARVGLRTSAR